MNFEAYVEKVKARFSDRWQVLSPEEVDAYFETEEVKGILAERYRFYLQPDHILHGTGSIASVAYCLEMMY
jgi:hypothetical protein